MASLSLDEMFIRLVIAFESLFPTAVSEFVVTSESVILEDRIQFTISRNLLFSSAGYPFHGLLDIPLVYPVYIAGIAGCMDISVLTFLLAGGFECVEKLWDIQIINVGITHSGNIVIFDDTPTKFNRLNYFFEQAARIDTEQPRKYSQ